MPIGAHMSVAKGLNKALDHALSINADTMQIFTRNPRGGKAKALDLAEVELFKKRVQEHNFGPWVAHAPYTVNLASAKNDVREFGVQTLKEDLRRVDALGGKLLVVHSGAHTGAGREQGLARLIEALREILAEAPQEVSLLLEMMSASGSELGSTFAEISQVLETLNAANLGVCLDTAHLFAAGYDVRDWDNVWQKVMQDFGAERVKAIHLNDSLVDLGAHKDRHARLGEGMIGLEAFKNIVTHPSTKELPLILETPNELDGWQKEIEVLREFRRVK